MIEMQKQVMAPLDYEMAQLHENMEMSGVELILEDGVKQVARRKTRWSFCLPAGKQSARIWLSLSIGGAAQQPSGLRAGLAECKGRYPGQ
ncbi:MAG: hypothetical protein ACLUOI_08220 [Eisenbergiella sp.]